MTTLKPDPDKLPPGVSSGTPLKSQKPLTKEEADALEAQLRAGERASGFGIIRPPSSKEKA